jgi:hypothetical protein
MNEAKIQISTEELELVGNADWILTKNRILGKVNLLFGVLAEKMETELKNADLPGDFSRKGPKISKGENYHGLPYTILDYPRMFSKEEVFAIRTFFWWANYFSVTLHLKGGYKAFFANSIRKNIDLLSGHHFYIARSNDEWVHQLDEENYIPVRQTDLQLRESIFSQQLFLKFSVKFNLNQWNEAEDLLLNAFKILLQVLHP